MGIQINIHQAFRVTRNAPYVTYRNADVITQCLRIKHNKLMPLQTQDKVIT